MGGVCCVSSRDKLPKEDQRLIQTPSEDMTDLNIEDEVQKIE